MQKTQKLLDDDIGRCDALQSKRSSSSSECSTVIVLLSVVSVASPKSSDCASRAMLSSAESYHFSIPLLLDGESDSKKIQIPSEDLAKQLKRKM